jgi:hypothetical protein
MNEMRNQLMNQGAFIGLVAAAQVLTPVNRQHQMQNKNQQLKEMAYRCKLRKPPVLGCSGIEFKETKHSNKI